VRIKKEKNKTSGNSLLAFLFFLFRISKSLHPRTTLTHRRILREKECVFSDEI